MSNPLPRSLRPIIGAALVAGVGFVVFRATRAGHVPEHAGPPAAETAPSAPAPAASTPPATTPADIEPVASALLLPGGQPAPELPDTAPDAVSFGVVLVTYRGAEEASETSRSKSDALKRAKELVPLAQSHFEDAVKQGDRGSVEDAGKLPRGVLEPQVEYVLFTLKKGEVYGEPIDTPRGYWVVRRNE
jgi:hypothetical protein